MSNILDQIIDHKRTEVAAARAATPLADLTARAASAAPPRNFFAAVSAPSPNLNVIAEVKKASPSAGLIREDFDPVAIASAYHRAGAAAISCLTDEKFFQGKLEYLEQIRAVIPLPVLRKDFIIDDYQIIEARAHGADAILLIAECLDDTSLQSLLATAANQNLSILVEVHDRENLHRVQPLIAQHPNRCLLGINNRDLRTMTTDLDHSIQLVDDVPDLSIFVSESGIRTHADTLKLKAHNINAVLVGESLMKQPDPEVALRTLIHG